MRNNDTPINLINHTLCAIDWSIIVAHRVLIGVLYAQQ